MILGTVRMPVNFGPRRHSTLRGRRLTAYEQAVERIASSRAGAWMFVHPLSAIDRRLLALTRGRVSLALGAPVGLLETTGARTGHLRRVPVLYVAEEPCVVLIASNGGRPRDPAWLHNLRARADVRLLTREHGWRNYRARVATGAERARYWRVATDFYAGYEGYQQRTRGRPIPVVVLDPLPPQCGIEMPPAT